MTITAASTLSGKIIAVVIPAYNCATHIVPLIRAIPSWVRHIVVVDDASTDDFKKKMYEINDKRVVTIRHEHNKGVGAAFKTGSQKALELGADILVKMDGDGQMDPEHLPRLIDPVINGRADFSKGNRFHDLSALRAMPKGRILGNMGLSFLLKLASGYWNIFDPTNGYIALSADLFKYLNKTKIANRFYFECSLLIRAGFHRFVIEDVPMPAYYGQEDSFLPVWRTLFEFPPRIVFGALQRFIWQYILLDFTAVSVFTLVGFPSLLWGAGFGLWAWIHSAMIHRATPTGTIMLSVLPIIIGIQLLSQAVVIDIGNTPKKVKTKNA